MHFAFLKVHLKDSKAFFGVGTLPFLIVYRENLKKAIRRERRKDFPTEPTSLADLGPLPESYRKTSNGETFILFDNWDDEDEERVVAFATRRNLQLLANSRTWFLDGTFKTAPGLFTQVRNSY